MYWVKRKIRQIKRVIGQIKRVIDFLPLIWNGFDWDYLYAIQLFQKQLERTASFLESDKVYSLSSKTNAQKIRTALRLMDIVYEERYMEEFFDSNSKDIEEYKRVIEKQKRAHKLLWDFIEHNIQYWWD